MNGLAAVFVIALAGADLQAAENWNALAAGPGPNHLAWADLLQKDRLAQRSGVLEQTPVHHLAGQTVRVKLCSAVFHQEALVHRAERGRLA